MLVLLPSHGIYGTTKVDLRIPTFGDIREVNNYNVEDILREYKFVEILTKVDLSKITYCDLRYLFSLASMNVLLNILRFPLKCKNPNCSEHYTKIVKLSDLEIKQLPKIKLPYTRYVGGIKYTFRLLSAQDVLDAYTWAQYEDNEEVSFEDAKVASILGIDMKDVEKVKSIPVSVYVGALLFDRMNYHGLLTNVEAVCPKCKHVYKFSFDLTAKALQFPTDKLMNRYAGVSMELSFIDFLRLSVNEFNELVTIYNKRL